MHINNEFYFESYINIVNFKFALAIETGSYLPTNPANKIDFMVNDVANMVKFVKPALKTRGIGQNIFANAAPAQQQL